MKILSIETSCDETSIAILEAKNNSKNFSWRILANVVHSQISIHEPWHGVVPNLAKREHKSNLIPVLTKALSEASLYQSTKTISDLDEKKLRSLKKILKKENDLIPPLAEFLKNTKKPKIDSIAVTHGPGLEPALWVGINFAKALSDFWEIPLIPVNHMDGHFLSSLLPENQGEWSKPKIDFPCLGLLISGGHTEIIIANDWHQRKVIGQTRDDAVGEAFDKVARMLGLPYPGGPQISALAKHYEKFEKIFEFPRPMINSNDLDFSFSGLKTSVLYRIKNLNRPITTEELGEIAFQFEEATKDVLTKKISKAINQFNPKTILVGGGVIANKKIRESLKDLITNNFPTTKIYLPFNTVTGDNAAMIGASAYIKILNPKYKIPKRFKANGSLKLGKS